MCASYTVDILPKNKHALRKLGTIGMRDGCGLRFVGHTLGCCEMRSKYEGKTCPLIGKGAGVGKKLKQNVKVWQKYMALTKCILCTSLLY